MDLVGRYGSWMYDRFHSGWGVKGYSSRALDPEVVSYQTVGFRLIWPPEIVSSHLGVLSLIKPGTDRCLTGIGSVAAGFPLVGRLWLEGITRIPLVRSSIGCLGNY